MKILALADVHNQEPILPESAIGVPDLDMLVIAGDLTGVGTLQQMERFATWLRCQPARHKIIIAGNHDFCLEKTHERQEAETMLGGNGIIYLRDQAVEIEGLKIYGTPWQPWFHDWAFNLERGPEIARKWELIPEGLDLLITHGPPQGYGDGVPRRIKGQMMIDRVGCADLLAAIKVKKPRYTVFGHIHEDPGQWQVGDSTLINCSVGEGYGRNGRFGALFDISPLPR